MSELRALQRTFAAALTAKPDRIHVAALAGPAERTLRRMRFYRGNVQANAAKALGNAYPVCRALTGDAFFEGLANVFATRVPATSGDLNEYGAGFPAFLADFPPATEIAYLSEVARLEWAVHRAHYAADAAPFDASKLAAVPPARFGEIVPRLNPACALVESRYPLARLWEIHQPGYAGEFAADFDGGRHHALVFRPRYKVEVAPLTPAEFAFLSACREGGNLDAAVKRAQAADADFALDAPLSRWIDTQVIVDLALPETA